MAFLGPNELSVIERCPYYRGVRKERLDCIETSIFKVNGDSLPGPLIIGTFEKRAPGPSCSKVIKRDPQDKDQDKLLSSG